ncbi:putative tetratricopeptide-like helical domain superfamily [Helianthus annuus]|nr:putative tetratricopeptide-like helical domain superfamily [Helianthus annuus]
MLQGLFRVGRCGEARKLFDEMRAHGHIPDECTYRIILDGLCNNHQVEEAFSLFHMVGDSKLNSHIVVYNILIEGASKCGKLDITKALFRDITLKGLQPNVRTFNCHTPNFHGSPVGPVGDYRDVVDIIIVKQHKL